MISAATLPHRRALAFYGASTEDSAPTMLSTGEASLHEADMLRRQSADANRNDPLLSNAIGILRRGLVANPYPFSADTAASAAFTDWARSCGHVHTQGSFASIQRMVAHTLIQDGECFVQRVWTRSRRSVNGMLLAVWPKRLVDKSRGHNYTGHEYDDGVWSGTWFQSKTIEPGFQDYEPTFVSADDLIWVRHTMEGDQVEGLPRFYAALESALQLEELSQTALVQQKVAACLAAFVIAENSIWGQRLDLGPRITDAAGNTFHELQPGTLPVVHGAKDVKTLVPGTSNAFNVNKHEGRVAAGTGLPRELIASDMSGMSFSAARHALLAVAEVVAEVAIDYTPFRDQVIAWWREAEIMVGRNWSSANFEWLPKPMPSIDPVKTAKANDIEVKNKTKSKRQCIIEGGRYPDTVFSEIEEEEERFGPPSADAIEPKDDDDDDREEDDK